MMSSARGFPVSWFGFFQLPDLVPKNRALYEALLTTHGTLALVLGVFVSLHAAPRSRITSCSRTTCCGGCCRSPHELRNER